MTPLARTCRVWFLTLLFMAGTAVPAKGGMCISATSRSSPVTAQAAEACCGDPAPDPIREVPIQESPDEFPDGSPDKSPDKGCDCPSGCCTARAAIVTFGAVCPPVVVEAWELLSERLAADGRPTGLRRPPRF